MTEDYYIRMRYQMSSTSLNRKSGCLLLDFQFTFEKHCVKMASMSFFWLAVLFEGGLAIVALFADLFFRLGLNYWQYVKFDNATPLQIVLGLLPLIAGYFVLQWLPFAALRQIDRVVRELFQQHMAHWKLGQLALVATFAGLGEELFFRGLLQLGLSIFVDVWLAILLTSLIFGLAHAVTFLYCILAFLVSLYLGLLFIHTDNLVVPIAVHALYDFFVFMYIWFTPHRT